MTQTQALLTILFIAFATLPGAVIAMLVVYCFKAATPLVWPHALPELIAGAYVVLVHHWKHNLVLSIGGGTVLYMLLVQLVFA